MKTSIAIVDDHRLFAYSLSDLVQKFDNYEVTIVAEHGRDLLKYLNRGDRPQLVLLDVHMPEMDGFTTAAYLKQNFPDIKVIALSMMDQEDHVVRMVQSGARGYLLKICRPAELRQALDDVCTKGYHYSASLTERLVKVLDPAKNDAPTAYFKFSGREHEFLKMACSDLTYAQIADKMCVSPRTVDGYRESLFEKMNVKSRVGMAIAAIRWGFFKLQK
ncbi:response regulator transcription factor [Tellurirhabdus bombi]|uniref:response regulator transcription factor n=1 Tax=Tellurirhabdus bombi TaxID=2907205 RepID=UPI001F2574F4|nr:response regulator transcription factor [Tellurirhabdus bombi]